MEKIESSAMIWGNSLSYAEFHAGSEYELGLTTFTVKNGRKRPLKFQFVWEKVQSAVYSEVPLLTKFVGPDEISFVSERYVLWAVFKQLT